MDAQQFAYWLQGYVEMGGATPTDEQWKMIKDHLALVFAKVTPVRAKGGTVALERPYRVGETPIEELRIRPQVECTAIAGGPIAQLYC